jgi:hypothetical protein
MRLVLLFLLAAVLALLAKAMLGVAHLQSQRVTRMAMDRAAAVLEVLVHQVQH